MEEVYVFDLIFFILVYFKVFSSHFEFWCKHRSVCLWLIFFVAFVFINFVHSLIMNYFYSNTRMMLKLLVLTALIGCCLCTDNQCEIRISEILAELKSIKSVVMVNKNAIDYHQNILNIHQDQLNGKIHNLLGKNYIKTTMLIMIIYYSYVK